MIRFRHFNFIVPLLPSASLFRVFHVLRTSTAARAAARVRWARERTDLFVATFQPCQRSREKETARDSRISEIISFASDNRVKMDFRLDRVERTGRPMTLFEGKRIFLRVFAMWRKASKNPNKACVWNVQLYPLKSQRFSIKPATNVRAEWEGLKTWFWNLLFVQTATAAHTTTAGTGLRAMRRMICIIKLCTHMF